MAIYNPPSWWTGAIPQWQESGPYKTTPQDYFQQVLYNRLIPYLDPLTQLSTAQWLARDNPYAWQAYSANTLPNMTTIRPMEGSQVSTFLTPDYFNKVISELNYNNIVNAMPTQTVRNMLNSPTIASRSSAAADAQSGLEWLTEAMKTAQTAAPGSTRNQQALAKGHLATLYKEAGQEPARGGMYRTLFENLVNPVVRTAPISGMFGTMRSTVPAPDRGTAQAAKNPFLT